MNKQKGRRRKTPDSELGKRIRLLFKGADNIEILAQIGGGYSGSAFGYYMQGKIEPPHSLLRKIVDLKHCEWEWLINGQEPIYKTGFSPEEQADAGTILLQDLSVEDLELWLKRFTEMVPEAGQAKLEPYRDLVLKEIDKRRQNPSTKQNAQS